MADLWRALNFTILCKMLLVIVLLRVVKSCWDWTRRRITLERIAGPRGTLLSGNLPWHIALFSQIGDIPTNVLLYDYVMGHMKLFATEKMFRTWITLKPYVVAVHPDAVEAILSSNTELNKTFEYGFIHDWLGTGLLTSTGSKWRSRRKLLTPTFHFRILDHFQEVFSEQSRVFVERLDQMSEARESLDITPVVSFLTLDIICETAMGTKLGSQSNSDTAYFKAVQVVGRTVMERIFQPWLWPDFLFRCSTSGKTFHRNLKVLHDFTNQVIRERKIESREDVAQHQGEDSLVGRRRLVFLDLLLAEQKSAGLSDKDIREEVDTFMFEGHDTTATGLCWAMYLLGLHPDVQDKVREELDQVLEGDSSITTEDLKRMRYLECVVKESQRLYPSVPFIGRELKANTTIGGQVVPGGTTCVIFPPGLHRRPDVFPDPELFEPDRFLPENSSGRHPYAYVPFSAGPRNCIGQRFAMNEEKTVLAHLLRRFHLQSLEERDKVYVSPEMVSRSSGPILIKFVRRTSSG